MDKLPEGRAIWMYQLNPKKGTEFVLNNGNRVPTSAENLWKMLQEEGPVDNDWYVTVNFRNAKAGDPVIIRVNDGFAGSRKGLVAFGYLSYVDSEKRSVGVRCDMKATRRLMDNPISLDEVRRIIPKTQSNIGNVTKFRRYIERWIFRDMGKKKTSQGQGKLPDQSKDNWTEILDKRPTLPPKPGKTKTSPEEIAQKREQANKQHHGLLVGLKHILIGDGWKRVEQKPGSVDMRAEKGRKGIFFEAKTIKKENESRQTRLALGQLFEYRYLHGKKNEKLCIVLSHKPEESRLGFLDSVPIGVIWPYENAFRGNGEAQRMLRGVVK